MVIERQVIGYTQYDLQSNYAVDDRVVSSSGGSQCRMDPVLGDVTFQ